MKNFLKNFRVLINILFSNVNSIFLHERLEKFYKNQAENYDITRKNFLHGREELIFSLKKLDLKDKILIDVGGGTGYNIELLGDKINDFKEIIICDLSDSLLEIANKKIVENNWKNVRTLKQNAENLNINADIIIFSYSLTMIPNWFLALESAYNCLSKNGIIAATDFYTSSKWPKEGYIKHSFFRRNIYPIFYTFDNVFLNKDHITWLSEKTNLIYKIESFGKIPLIPFYKCSYYVYVGIKNV